MHLHALDYVLWVATPTLQGCVIYFLRKRGLASQFPIFYFYNILQFTTDILLLWVLRISYTVYFYCYWAVVAAVVLLTFAIIDELFRLAFRAYAAFQTVGAKIFRWILLVMVLGACGLVFTLPHLHGAADFGELILMVDRCARIMLCLWALLLIIGSPLMRISPRSVLFGIALGVLVFAFAKIVIDTLFLSHAGDNQLAGRIDSFMYLASCALWTFYAACGEGLPVYEPLLGVSNSLQQDASGDDDKRSLMETINNTVDEMLRNTTGSTTR